MQLTFLVALSVLITLASCYQDGDVRIIKKGEENSEGNVEVFIHNQWSGICADNVNTWDMDAIVVVCGQLDYPYATNPATTGYYSRSNVTYLIYDVVCYGNEEELLECRYSNYSSPSVECNNPAAAACITSEEVFVYAMSFFLSCMFCCCSTFVVILMCFMIASCPLAAMAGSSRRPCNGLMIDDPSRPLMIDPNTNYKTKPPAYTDS